MTEPPRPAAGRLPLDRFQEEPAHVEDSPAPLATAAPGPIANARRVASLVAAHLRPATLRAIWRRSRSGTWRAAVEEDSMRPAILPGDWLLLDPTVRVWPRRGTVVVVREPDSEILAVKRVAARPGDHVRIPEGLLHLAENEAWVLGDNEERSVDSRRYGPVTFDRLVGRVWFRYWPLSRLGRPRGRRGDNDRLARATRFLDRRRGRLQP